MVCCNFCNYLYQLGTDPEFTETSGRREEDEGRGAEENEGQGGQEEKGRGDRKEQNGGREKEEERGRETNGMHDT